MTDRDQPADPGRRAAMECMAWAGAATVWTVSGGIASSALAAARPKASGALQFAQISDTHVGFGGAANPNALATFQSALDKINALPERPAFVLHTGDITHLSKPDQFDTADQMLRSLNLPVFYTPGEHDTMDEGNGKLFLEKHGAGTKGTGWRSFDAGGVHFIGLVNTVNLTAGGSGQLGAEQIGWLKDDIAHLRASTPLVVYAHMPLFDAYAPWGWSTSDAAAALEPLRRFGSVTVLNGHIHQVISKTEGSLVFHTARSTAFPQAAPGAQGASPGPLKVPGDQLRQVLGLRDVRRVAGRGALASTDETLA